MSLTEAIKEAYASAPTNIITLETLEISHPTFVDDQGDPAPIRVVMNNEPLTLGGLDFQPFNFRLTPPEITENGTAELSLVVDNASSEISRYIELAVHDENPVTIIYRPYLWDTSIGAQPPGSEGSQMDPPLTMTAKSITSNPFQITMKASFGDIVNKRFPPENYTYSKFPGLVR